MLKHTLQKRMPTAWLYRGLEISITASQFPNNSYRSHYSYQPHRCNHAPTLETEQLTADKLVVRFKVHSRLLGLLEDLESQYRHQPDQLAHACYQLDSLITYDQLNAFLLSEIKQLDNEQLTTAVRRLTPYSRFSHVAMSILSSVLASGVPPVTPSMLSEWIPNSTEELSYFQFYTNEQKSVDVLKWYRARCIGVKARLSMVNSGQPGTDIKFQKHRISEIERRVHSLCHIALWIPNSCDFAELSKLIEKSCSLFFSTDLLIWQYQTRFGQMAKKNRLDELRGCRPSGCHLQHPIELMKVLHKNRLMAEAANVADQISEDINIRLLGKPRTALLPLQNDRNYYDLSHLLPSLRAMVSMKISRSSKVHEAVRNVWEIVLVPNLSLLTIDQQIGGLELLSEYSQFHDDEKILVNNCNLSAMTGKESQSEKDSWIQQKWSQLWSSVVHSNDSIDLFAITRLLSLCDSLMPLPKPSMPAKCALEATITRADIFTLLNKIRKCSSEIITPEISFAQYQLEKFSVVQLLGLSRRLAQLLCLSINKHEWSPSNDHSELFETVLSVVDKQSMNEVDAHNHNFYFDCFHLALCLDPVENCSLSNKLTSILVDAARINGLGRLSGFRQGDLLISDGPRRHFIICQIALRSDWKRSDIAEIVLEAYRGIPHSLSPNDHCLIDHLMELSKCAQDQAWKVFCTWSCIPLTNSLKTNIGNLFDKMLIFLLSMSEFGKDLSTACEALPLAELPGALADGLNACVKYDIATLTRTAKLLQSLPFSLCGTVRLTDCLIRQITKYSVPPPSPFNINTDSISSYDELMFQLIESGILHSSILNNWLNKRVIPLLVVHVANRNFEHLPVWLTKMEKISISTPSLKRFFEQPLSFQSISLDIQWLYLGNCFTITSEKLQSRMLALLKVICDSQINHSLSAIDALRLYSVHIDLSLQLKTPWTDKVKSDSAIYNYLNNIPLLAWIKQHVVYWNLFGGSSSYQSIQASLIRLCSKEGFFLWGCDFKSGMKDVFYIDYYLEHSPYGRLAVLVIEPSLCYKVIYPTEQCGFEGLEYRYNVGVVSDPLLSSPCSLAEERTLRREFLKPLAMTRYNRLRAQGWNVVLIDLNKYHSKIRTCEEEGDIYLQNSFIYQLKQSHK